KSRAGGADDRLAQHTAERCRKGVPTPSVGTRNLLRDGHPMDRANHYEAAFEAYLQWHRLCYVAVDETRRSMLGEERVKSLDFIVHGPRGARLLVDVKGRRFPGGPAGKPRRVWGCWSTRDDVTGLERGAGLFG